MPTAAGLHYLYHEGGDQYKPAVIMIHGAGGDHLSWPPEMRRLPDYRVFAIDLPGHGKTAGPGFQSIEDYARSVIGLLDSSGLSRVVIVGYSMGGAIALSLALDYPDRVAGIALISTGPRLPIPPPVMENVANPSTFTLAVKNLLEMSSDSQTPASLKETLFKRLTTTRQTLVLSDLLACDRFDVINRLGDIHTPTLVVCGTEDKLTPIHSSETLSSRIQGAALQTVDGTGHLLVFEQPRHLTKLVNIFLATIPYLPGM